MASKYAHVIGDLMPLPVEDMGRQAKINEVKDAIRATETHNGESLTKEYKRARFGAATTTPPMQVIRVGDREHPMPVDEEALIALYGVEGLKDLLWRAELRLDAVEQMLDESRDKDEPGWGTHGAAENAVRLPSGETLRIDPDPVGQVEDRDKFLAWCIANGYQNQLALHYQTMNAVAKALLLDGQPLPDGVKVYLKPKFVFTKPRAPK